MPMPGRWPAADWLAVRLAHERGLAASFHPHISTHAQSAWEVDRLLKDTEVTTCYLDIGHLALAGADPVDCVRNWAARIDHAHIEGRAPAGPA
jgi:inosose dehydratase